MIARRKFLKSIVSCTVAVTLTRCTRQAATPAPRRVALGPITSFTQVKTVKFVERVLVLRDARGLSAMSLVCTHQSCMVHEEEGSEGKYLCPCHGSRFDPFGRVLGGPAAKDLPFLELSVDDDGILHVIFGSEVTPEWRLPNGGSV